MASAHPHLNAGGDGALQLVLEMLKNEQDDRLGSARSRPATHILGGTMPSYSNGSHTYVC